ncbi:unnamed protein product [Oppiella nova]|uniref:CDK5RAP1-like protein n=1 Tax=Oppiella nova TaxID=334625 RepID=A0A7R9LR46_9ACAR|nr:unnamed protein product [Oppiella nova]CAG2166141.1 unnamed protein product [Oppiella nova]
MYRRCHLLRQLVVTHRHHLQVCPLVSHLSTRLSSATASSTAATQIKTIDSRFPKSGPDLQHFIRQSQESDPIRSEPFVVSRSSPIPYIDEHVLDGQGAKVFIRTYGCQMNVNDTQIATTILKNSGYDIVDDINKASIVMLMTCAIRENAESKVWAKLKELSQLKSSGRIRQIGLLGCVAERLKSSVLQKQPSIDVIAGPDSYRDLPKLLAINRSSAQNAVNVLLSLDETYSDIQPSVQRSAVTAFVSIMRGCDNMCSYCIVPFTRGRERSRSLESIVSEVKQLSELGVKEVTLLGQNVNSYRDKSAESTSSDTTGTGISLVPGFKTIYKRRSGGLTFDVLLDAVASVDPNLRIRFTSPHPKDFDERALRVIQKHPNIANCIHLPVQSGSNSVLTRMRRGYTREAYLSLVDRIRDIIPNCALSSDFICGFCGETDDEHQETVDIVRRVGYQSAYTFAYSMRAKTHAFHTLTDDVPQEVKVQRLNELNALYREIAFDMNRRSVGERQLILVEDVSKKSDEEYYGRNEANLKVIVPKVDIPVGDSGVMKSIAPGDYVLAEITDCSSITLMGRPVCHQMLANYH